MTKKSKAYKTAQKYLSSKRSPVFKSARKVGKKLGRAARLTGKDINKYARKKFPVAGRAVIKYLQAGKAEHARYPTTEEVIYQRMVGASRGKQSVSTRKKKIKHTRKPVRRYVRPTRRYDPYYDAYYPRPRRRRRRYIPYYRPEPKPIKKKKRRKSSGGSGYFGGMPKTIVDTIQY
jgi:hypothetical protein